MVVLAQLVRASVCGTEGRGFEPHIPPQVFKSSSGFRTAFFVSCHSEQSEESIKKIIF
jgi:hypothetical protein